MFLAAGHSVITDLRVTCSTTPFMTSTGQGFYCGGFLSDCSQNDLNLSVTFI